MIESLQSFAIGTIGLDIALVIALGLALVRPTPGEAGFASLKPLMLAGIALHALHLSEETAFGFYERFPQLLGLAPWPLGLFLAFNLAWLFVWAVCIWMRRPNTLVLTAVWFLAIASALNGLAHPALSLLVRGYFPGLLSSPLVGVLGYFLLRRLRDATREFETPQTAA